MGLGGGLHIDPPIPSYPGFSSSTRYGAPTIFRLYFFAIANSFSMSGGSSARGATSAIDARIGAGPRPPPLLPPRVAAAAAARPAGRAPPGFPTPALTPCPSRCSSPSWVVSPSPAFSAPVVRWLRTEGYTAFSSFTHPLTLPPSGQRTTRHQVRRYRNFTTGTSRSGRDSARPY